MNESCVCNMTSEPMQTSAKVSAEKSIALAAELRERLEKVAQGVSNAPCKPHDIGEVDCLLTHLAVLNNIIAECLDDMCVIEQGLFGGGADTRR